MKKYLFIILVCIVWIVVPTHSKAYSEEQKELFKEEYYEQTGITLSEYSLNNVLTFWENKGVVQNNFSTPYLYTFNEINTYCNFRFCNSNDRLSGTTLQARSGDYAGSPDITNATNGNSWYITEKSYNGTYDNPPNLHEWGSFEEWNNSHIDYSWTNVSYDSSVPTPIIDVNLSKNYNEKVFNSNPNATLFGQLGPEIPYMIGFPSSDAYEGYYIYLDMTVWTPTSGEVSLENGIYKFTPKKMQRLPEFKYLDWSDMKEAPYENSSYFYWTNTTLTGVTIDITQQDNLSEWQNIRRGIEIGTGDYPQMSYTSTLTGSDREEGISRINQMLRNTSLAGNRVMFRACLYYINENNEIKCGNFATWTSAQPSSPTTEQPSINAQAINQPASGITQTVSYDNIVEQNESTSNIPPVNVTTGGTNVNVTVNTGEQNVPNNQNYPTVVSYNHDNIFTTFIGTYNSASQYLGGFASFCNSCLLWIPSEIWSIIGMGFAMALVIMIVKIL